MANNNVLKISSDKLGEIVSKIVQNRMMTIAGAGGNPGGIPNRPYDAPKEDPKNPWVPAPKRFSVKEPVLPNFKPMGRVIKGTRKGVLSPEENIIRQQLLQIGPQANASSRQIRDRLKPFTKGSGYDNTGGSLRGIPDALRIQLLRDAMAKNLPANNIRRLQDTGHMTIPQNADGTGPLRIIDLLGPQNPPQA